MQRSTRFWLLTRNYISVFGGHQIKTGYCCNPEKFFFFLLVFYFMCICCYCWYYTTQTPRQTQCESNPHLSLKQIRHVLSYQMETQERYIQLRSALLERDILGIGDSKVDGTEFFPWKNQTTEVKMQERITCALVILDCHLDPVSIGS